MTRLPHRLLTGALVVGVLALPFATVSTADAAPKAKHYKTCAALNHDYPHGVGKKKATDKVGKTTKPVTNFTRNDKVYGMNDGPRSKKTGEYDLDRDNDGVACEKR